MQVDTQMFLNLVENTNKLCFFDLEATGFRGDYNTILTASIKPYNKKPYTFAIKQVGNDQKVVRDMSEALSEYDCWVSFYGKGFDVPMLNTRLLKWGAPALEHKHHLDMFFSLKHKLALSRKSQAHYLGWLDVDEKKMGVSPDVWAGISTNMEKNLPILIKRCESDTVGLEALYKKTRHLVMEIKR